MIFCGGWLSFNGEMGKGGWGRTRLSEILPVVCGDVEDLVENTEGFALEPELSEHPILEGVDLRTAPPILGYNRTKLRLGADLLATWRGGRDPAIAAAAFGKGRVLCYTSDPAPHWGCNFVFWEGYAGFWSNACDWVAGHR